MSDLTDALSIAASGMRAQRVRLQATSSNIANARTTKTEEGGPYKRRVTVFEAQAIDPFGDELDRQLAGVKVDEIELSDATERIFDPSHPHADEDGYVEMPKIDLMAEMVDLMNVSRTYEANANAIDVTKDLAQRAIDIGK
ncbi:MAG TPA: flagellar basal body rod protein FlgC [Myxococcota bacterium]|nr:flagellar basal body rod protein FlgC [Myxococcota bacterium]